MSKTEKIYRFGIDVEATTSQAQKDLASLGEILKSLKLPDSTKKSFGELFETANSNLETFIALSSKTTHTEKDVKDLGKAYNNVSNAIAMMSTKLAGIEAMDLKSLLPKDLQKQLKEVRSELQSLQDLAKGDNSEQIQNQTAKVVKQKEKVDELTKSVQELNATLAEGGEQWNKQNAASQVAEEATAKWEQATKAVKDYQSKHKNIMTQQEYEESKKRTTTYREQQKEYQRLSKGKDSVYQKEKSEAKQDLEDKKQLLAQTDPKAKKTYTTLEIQVRKQQERYDKQYNDLANTRRKDTNLLKSQKDINQEESRQREYDEYKKLIDAQQEAEKAKSSATQKAQKTSEETSNFAKKAEEQASKLSKQQAQLQEYEKNLEAIKKAAQGTEGLQNLRKALAQIQGVDISEIPEDLTDIEHLIDNLESEKIKELATGMAKLRETTNQTSDSVVRNVGEATKKFDEQKESVDSLDAQVKSLQNSFLNFFSLTNGWSLLQRAIKNAYATVKELDASMTEIAVVSEYTIDDIWAMRGKYSDAATEMGAKTIDLVDATKLLVQQGLSLNQSLETGIEVTKMARIANLSGADATNLMTAQLRGFNMEMSEANRVSDVFSNLAAKTQADTEEIAVALSKTASIANSAGASFENTSAFLTQIVETTREAPETAGTALKTIIARFQELKKPMSEIGEVEGEVVDANAIETALKTAGVALRDVNGEFRNFDDVILELSSKWESLDVMTQRYIQTTQAGSRQQSRFLALMSNNERLTELVGYANNAAGASNQQYEKTLESLEAKINNLNNAMDIFWTNLANSDVIKGAIDLLTKLLNAINGITNGLTQSSNKAANFMGTLAQLGLVIAGFAGGKKILKGGVEKIGGWFLGMNKGAGTAGMEGGKQYQEGFMKGFKEKGGILGIFKDWKENLGNVLKDAKKFGQDWWSSVKKGMDATTDTKEYSKETKELQKVYKDLVRKRESGDDSIDDQTLADQKKKFEDSQALDPNTLTKGAKAGAIFKGLFGKKETRAAAVQKLGTQDMLIGKAMTALPIGYIAAAAAVTVGVTKIVNQQIVTTDEKIAEVNNSIDQLQDNISKTNEKISDLKSGRSTLQGLNDDFNSLVKGSSEWKEKLVEVNQQILSLINKYPELASYIERGSQGQLDISETGWDAILEQQMKINSIQQTALGSSRIYQQDLTNRKNAETQMLQSEKEQAQWESFGADQAAVILGALGAALLPGIGPVIAQQALAGFGVANIGMRLSGEKPLTQQAWEAQAKGNAGASADQYQSMLTVMGEKGLNVYNKKELQKEFNIITNNKGNFDKFYENLKALGDGLDAITQESYANKVQMEGQRKTILSNVIANNESLSSQEEVIDQMEGAAQKLVNVNVDETTLEKALGSELYDSEDGKIKDDLKARYASIMGITVDEVNAQLKSESLSEDTMARIVYAKQQEKDLADNMKKTADALQKLKLSNVKNYDIAKNLLSNNGLNLTAEQLATFNNLKELSTETINSFFEQMGVSVQQLGTDTEQVIEYIKNAQSAEQGLFDLSKKNDIESETKAADQTFGQIAGSLSLNVRNTLQNVINEAFSRGVDVKDSQVVIEGILKDIANAPVDDSVKAQAYSQLTVDSLSTINNFNNLQSTLNSLGINVSSTTEKIANTMNLINDLDFSKLTQQILATKDAINKTIYGQKTYTQADVERLGFTDDELMEIINSDGSKTYRYIGSRTQNQLTKDYTANKGISFPDQKTLDSLYRSVETAQKKVDKLEKYQNVEEKYRDFDLAEIGTEYSKAAGDVFNRKKRVNEWYDKGYLPMLNNYAKYIKELRGIDIFDASFYDDFFAEKGYSEIQTEMKQDSANIAKFLLGMDREWVQPELVGYLKQKGVTDTHYAHNVEELQGHKDYINAFGDLDTATKEYEQQKNKLLSAVQTQDLGYLFTLQTGEFKDYEEFTDDFYKYLIASADEYDINEALQNQLRNSFSDVGEISNDLVSQAINEINSTKAAQLLGEKLSEIASKVDVVDKLTDDKAKKDYKKSILDQFFGDNAANIDEKDIDVVFDNLRAAAEGGYENFLTLIQYSTEDQAHTMIDSTTKVITNNEKDISDDLYNLWAAGGLLEGKQVKVGDLQVGQYTIDKNNVVTKINQDMIDKWKELGVPDVTVLQAVNQESYINKILNNGLLKDKSFEASYDWLYNLTKKMNKELRERNKLEKEENNILDARTTTVADLLDNINEQKQSLLQSLSYENERYTKRQKELNKANSDARRYQVSQYVWMDKDNTVQIDYDAIKGITDPAIGNLVKQMVEEYEFLQSEFESIEDNQDEYTSALKEIKTKYLQDSITLENELIEAIHTDRQKQIDKLSEINSSINDANSRMMDKISQGITDIRNAREDDKALKNIQEMEQRLALLRTDTSGANALEILSLEEQLNDARTSYADTQVDRAIDEMTRQNDEAAQQREWQIQLLEDQLEADREYGVLAAQANELIRAALMDGSESQANTIKEILNKASDSQSLGYYGQQDFFDTMQDKVVKGIAGAILSASPEYGQKVTFTDKNGNLIKDGIAQADGSVFAGGKYYTNVFGFEDSTGNFSYMQHQSGKALSQGDWEQQTGLKANTGKVDLVKVSESTLNEVKDIRNILDKNYEKEQKIQEANKVIDNFAKSTTGSPDGRQGNAIIALRKIFGTDTEMVSYLKNSGLSEDQLELFLSIINSLNNNSTKKSQKAAPSRMISGIPSFRIFKTGGLNSSTGPAWLDGTKTAPEYVLNAEQTKAFLSLVNSLTSYSATSTPLGNNYYNVQIEVDQLANDYDVEQLMNKMKRVIADDALYRNVNAVDLGRR